MSDLRTLPAIRAEAERLARETYEAQSKTLYAHGMGPSLLWELLPERMRTAYVGAHIDLLCDLSRPASMDAVARLVAAKVGLVCGATAPEFKRTVGGDGWLFRAGWGAPEVEFVEGVRKWTTFNPIRPTDFFLAASLDGIGTITDPADALRLIALHVLRSPDV